MIVLIITAAILAIMGIIVLIGKGDNLIAGYNTASKAEREQYHIKRLRGLIGGLLARGYTARDAATLGVWIHGRAADALTARYTAEAYSSRDLIDALYTGFKALE